MRGLEQLVKFTYIRETDEGDGMDQMRDLKQWSSFTYQTWIWIRGWDGMIDRGLNQLVNVTYELEMDKGDGMGWDDQMRGLEQLVKFTYILETDEGDGMG